MIRMLLKVKAHASSKEDSCVKKAEDSYEIWVRAPALRGLANQAVLGLLARALNRNPKQLRVIKGSQAPNKIVQVWGE